MSETAPQKPVQALISDLRSHLAYLKDSVPPDELTLHLEHAARTLDSLSHQIAAHDRQMEQSLQDAILDRARFVSIMTHELRVPMTSIKGYTDLISQGVAGPVSEQQLGFLQVIRSNVDRMTNLVSDLSDISRIESGRLKLESAAVSFSSQAEKAIQDLQPLLREKRLSYQVMSSPGLPQIAADPARFSQILGSMVRNAIMYTQPGGEISISASFDDHQVKVEISDNGIGIKPEEHSRLFTPFFRSDDPAVRDQNGWGLSLYVSSRLIDLMGGSMGMHSSIGQGSTFWFTLPLAAG